MKGMKRLKESLASTPRGRLGRIHEFRDLHGEEPFKLGSHEGHEDHEEAKGSVFVLMAMTRFPSSASW